MSEKISPIDEHLALKLREFRIFKAMSQEKLGELTGVTAQQIQKYEKAQNRISASKLFEFSQILQKPITSFFEGIKSDRSYYNYDFLSSKLSQKLDSKQIDKNLIPLIRAFNQINCPNIRKNLIILANSMAKVFRKKKVKHQYS